MMFARRFVLLFALLVAALPAAAREAPYLTPQDLDLMSYLPTPNVAGSVAHKEQLALVLKMQQTMPADRIEQAKRDATETLDVAFSGVLGKPLTAASLPATTHLMARLTETEDVVVEPAKTAFGRAREVVHLQPHLFGRTVRRPARVGLVRNDLRLHEVGDPACEVGHLGGRCKVQVHDTLLDYTNDGRVFSVSRSKPAIFL